MDNVIEETPAQESITFKSLVSLVNYIRKYIDQFKILGFE